MSVLESLCVRTVKEKRLKLSTPNLVNNYSMAGPRHALTQNQKVKGQGNAVIKYTASWPMGCMSI